MMNSQRLAAAGSRITSGNRPSGGNKVTTGRAPVAGAMVPASNNIITNVARRASPRNPYIDVDPVDHRLNQDMTNDHDILAL